LTKAVNVIGSCFGPGNEALKGEGDPASELMLKFGFGVDV